MKYNCDSFLSRNYSSIYVSSETKNCERLLVSDYLNLFFCVLDIEKEENNVQNIQKKEILNITTNKAELSEMRTSYRYTVKICTTVCLIQGCYPSKVKFMAMLESQ